MKAAEREIRAVENTVADIARRHSANIIRSRPRIHGDIRGAFAEVVAIVGTPGGEAAGGHGGANRNAIDFCAGETLNAVMQLASGESLASSWSEIDFPFIASW